MNTLSSKFLPLKYNAFDNYNFTKTIVGAGNSLLNLDNFILQTGNSEFSILPVAISFESDRIPTVKTFTSDCQNSITNDKLETILKENKLPPVFIGSRSRRMTGVTDCFKFSYKLSSIVCNSVNGKGFLNYVSADGSNIWIVILKATNDIGQNSINKMENYSFSDADEWYRSTLIC
jgi:hypothetical protein